MPADLTPPGGGRAEEAASSGLQLPDVSAGLGLVEPDPLADVGTDARGDDPVVARGGGDGRRVAAPSWRQMVRRLLPLWMLALLAAVTFWLVRNAPQPAAPAARALPVGVPDYTMERFSVQRFAADGRLQARIEGDRLRHFVDADRMQIERLLLRAEDAQGRPVEARARTARTEQGAETVHLEGGARVTRREADGRAWVVEGEQLTARRELGIVESLVPVQMRQGASRVEAAGLRYDSDSGVVDLRGPVRAVIRPQQSAQLAGETETVFRGWPKAASPAPTPPSAGASR